MAVVETPVVQRVLERLIYEGALLHNQLVGRRRRVRLGEVLHAAQSEPRIIEVLPALLRRKPGAIYRVKQDLPDHPDLQQLLADFDAPQAPKRWRGVPIARLRKADQELQTLWEHQQRSTTKWRTMNLRLTDADVQRLERLAEELGLSGKSAVIRHLLAQAVA